MHLVQDWKSGCRIDRWYSCSIEYFNPVLMLLLPCHHNSPRNLLPISTEDSDLSNRCSSKDNQSGYCIGSGDHHKAFLYVMSQHVWQSEEELALAPNKTRQDKTRHGWPAWSTEITRSREQYCRHEGCDFAHRFSKDNCIQWGLSQVLLKVALLASNRFLGSEKHQQVFGKSTRRIVWPVKVQKHQKWNLYRDAVVAVSLLPLRGLSQWRLKARASLNQVPWDQWPNVPSERHEGNPPSQFCGRGALSPLIRKQKKTVAKWASAWFTWPPSNPNSGMFNVKTYHVSHLLLASLPGISVSLLKSHPSITAECAHMPTCNSSCISHDHVW